MTERHTQLYLSTCGIIFILKDGKEIMRFSDYTKFKHFTKMVAVFAFANDPNRTEKQKK